VTANRVIAVSGRPAPSLDIASFPVSYELWRRDDGRGTIAFSQPETRSEIRDAGRIFATAIRFIAFLVGLASFPRRRSAGLVVYEVDDIDTLVATLAGLGSGRVIAPRTDPTSDPSTTEALRDPIEQRFTPHRRIACGVAGALLLTTTLPVIAVRARAYLQDSPTLQQAGTLTVALPPATYVVFEHPNSLGPYDCSPDDPCATIDTSDVSVSSPSGSHLVVVRDPKMEAITDKSYHYGAAVQFTVTRPGTYAVHVRRTVPASFVVAKKPSEEILSLAGWIAGAVGGLLLIVVALVGGLIARGRRRQITAAGPPIPTLIDGVG
jgi:hypothetical protein